MRDGDGKQLDGKDEKIAYAIESLKVSTKTFKLELFDEDNNDKTNKWELYDINYMDIWVKMDYNKEKTLLMKVYDTLKDNVEILEQYRDSKI